MTIKKYILLLLMTPIGFLSGMHENPPISPDMLERAMNAHVEPRTTRMFDTTVVGKPEIDMPLDQTRINAAMHAEVPEVQKSAEQEAVDAVLMNYKRHFETFKVKAQKAALPEGHGHKDLISSNLPFKIAKWYIELYELLDPQHQKELQTTIRTYLKSGEGQDIYTQINQPICIDSEKMQRIQTLCRDLTGKLVDLFNAPDRRLILAAALLTKFLYCTHEEQNQQESDHEPLKKRLHIAKMYLESIELDDAYTFCKALLSDIALASAQTAPTEKSFLEKYLSLAIPYNFIQQMIRSISSKEHGMALIDTIDRQLECYTYAHPTGEMRSSFVKPTMANRILLEILQKLLHLSFSDGPLENLPLVRGKAVLKLDHLTTPESSLTQIAGCHTWPSNSEKCTFDFVHAQGNKVIPCSRTLSFDPTITIQPLYNPDVLVTYIQTTELTPRIPDAEIETRMPRSASFSDFKRDVRRGSSAGKLTTFYPRCIDTQHALIQLLQDGWMNQLCSKKTKTDGGIATNIIGRALYLRDNSTLGLVNIFFALTQNTQNNPIPRIMTAFPLALVEEKPVLQVQNKTISLGHHEGRYFHYVRTALIRMAASQLSQRGLTRSTNKIVLAEALKQMEPVNYLTYLRYLTHLSIRQLKKLERNVDASMPKASTEQIMEALRKVRADDKENRRLSKTEKLPKRNIAALAKLCRQLMQWESENLISVYTPIEPSQPIRIGYNYKLTGFETPALIDPSIHNILELCFMHTNIKEITARM